MRPGTLPPDQQGRGTGRHDHTALTRHKPGNLRLDLWQEDDPLVWHLPLSPVQAKASRRSIRHARAFEGL